VKILVVGASKGTGALAVGAALEHGHEVTAFSRNPAGLAEHPGLRRLAGSFHDAAAVADAIAGQDAVITTAMVGSLATFKQDPTYLSRGAAAVIEGMKQKGVRRLVVLSALGVGDSKPLFNWLLRKLLVEGLLRGPYEDHEREELLVRQSGLDWTLARPSSLTNGAAKRRYKKTAALEKVPMRISRADVADFLIAACEDPSWIGKAVQLGG
jgi:uncharacterized protein YbjT (DUF2867 family)